MFMFCLFVINLNTIDVREGAWCFDYFFELSKCLLGHTKFSANLCPRVHITCYEGYNLVVVMQISNGVTRVLEKSTPTVFGFDYVFGISHITIQKIIRK